MPNGYIDLDGVGAQAPTAAEQAAAASAIQRLALGKQRSLVRIGDSRVSNGRIETSYARATTSLDYWAWGQHCTPGGPVFDVIANKGVASETTAQVLARFDADVVALKPTAVEILCGTNDGLANAASIDASVANVQAMVNKAIANGVFVFLSGEVTSANKGTTFSANVARYNAGLLRIAQKNPGVAFLDLNSQIIDPLSVNGYPLANVLFDGTHFSALGAFKIGKYIIAPALARWPSRGMPLVASIRDNRGISAAAKNLCRYGVFQGSGGVLGSGHTGTISSNVTSSGTAAAVLSTPARADGVGNNQQAVVTASAASQTFILEIGGQDVTHLVVGKSYVLRCELEISGASNLSICAVRASEIGQSANQFDTGALENVLGAVGPFPSDTGVMLIETPEMVLPSDTYSAMPQIRLLLTFSAAGGATVKWGRVSFDQVD